MAPWTFDVKFPYVTQFTFGSLTFAAGEDGNLMILPPGSALEHLTPVYGQAPCFLTISSTIGGACSSLDPYAGLHIRTIKLVRGILIMTSILHPSAGASSSSSSAASPIKIQLMITLRMREVPVGTPLRRTTSLSWSPRLEDLRRIATTDIPLSEDQKCPMLGHPMME
jgi:hypothetical protein